jgi:hypothetical protein
VVIGQISAQIAFVTRSGPAPEHLSLALSSCGCTVASQTALRDGAGSLGPVSRFTAEDEVTVQLEIVRGVPDASPAHVAAVAHAAPGNGRVDPSLFLCQDVLAHER